MNIRFAALDTRAVPTGCRLAPGEEKTRMHKQAMTGLEVSA
jgi:hypothetical protein